jgi:hypothetical protein
VGFLVLPPAYPTRVRMTPLRLPNRESGPQNQPKAKVAVSVLAGADVSMGGTDRLDISPLFVRLITLFSLTELRGVTAKIVPEKNTCNKASILALLRPVITDFYSSAVLTKSNAIEFMQ